MALPILCYHKVGHESSEGRWLTIPPQRLATHVRYFARRGRRFLLPRDLDRPWPLHAVCFTFDDAYASALENAPDIFQRHQARCAFYAVAGKVGQSSDWDGERARPLATWEALVEAEADGFEIGNHSMTHRLLADLPPEEQELDVRGASEELRQRGLTPGSLCYPYGAHSPVTLSAAEACGYRIGLVLGKRLARRSDPLLALPRIVLGYGDGLPMLLYKMHLRPRLP
jgi:peptidoglycan/xylan/chitin deacetylase (PgdA/CDA1 family)